jgi:hypothetical protein
MKRKIFVLHKIIYQVPFEIEFHPTFFELSWDTSIDWDRWNDENALTDFEISSKFWMSFFDVFNGLDDEISICYPNHLMPLFIKGEW